MHKSNPQHTQDYQQAHRLTESLHRTNAFSKLVALIQEQTSPLFGDNANLFNQNIASKFTELSLMSQSAVANLNTALNELEKFLTTLSVVNDQGRTAFMVTKSRFEGDALSNPLSLLYREVNQLPDPISSWAKRVADDTWFILISDTRNYINHQWQQTVVRDYHYTISNRYPFNAATSQEVAIGDFDRFFSHRGVLNRFIEQYLRPFLDTSKPQWQLKEVNNYVLPISAEMINELIRANVISNMFFPDGTDSSKIEFSLQKLSLDPVLSSLELVMGNTTLKDTQDSESLTHFHWPLSNARLSLKSIEGNHYELDENGPWAFFRMLQKVNVLVDEQDSSNLQILFEVNGNSGRYVLKTDNQVNPFIPGILNGFTLNDSIA